MVLDFHLVQITHTFVCFTFTLTSYTFHIHFIPQYPPISVSALVRVPAQHATYSNTNFSFTGHYHIIRGFLINIRKFVFLYDIRIFKDGAQCYPRYFSPFSILHFPSHKGMIPFYSFYCVFIHGAHSRDTLPNEEYNRPLYTPTGPVAAATDELWPGVKSLFTIFRQCVPACNGERAELESEPELKRKKKYYLIIHTNYTQMMM